MSDSTRMWEIRVEEDAEEGTFSARFVNFPEVTPGVAAVFLEAIRDLLANYAEEVEGLED